MIKVYDKVYFPPNYFIIFDRFIQIVEPEKDGHVLGRHKALEGCPVLGNAVMGGDLERQR